MPTAEGSFFLSVPRWYFFAWLFRLVFFFSEVGQLTVVLSFLDGRILASILSPFRYPHMPPLSNGDPSPSLLLLWAFCFFAACHDSCFVGRNGCLAALTGGSIVLPFRLHVL